MIYSTLKANKEHGKSYMDIINYYDECYACVGELFGDEYVDDNEYTDFDKLFADKTERQIASACLKALRKDDTILEWNKMLFDLDLPELVFDELKKLCKEGVITGSRQLREIGSKAKKKGVTIKKEVCYDQENHYYRFEYIDDIVDEYYPCYADTHDDFCNNCGNCQ